MGRMVTSSRTGFRRFRRMLRLPPEHEGLCHTILRSERADNLTVVSNRKA
jgi:hypothetical protein